MARLGDLGDIFIGLTYKPEDIAVTGTIVLRSGNIQDGALDFTDIIRVSKKINSKLFVMPNDILMCSRNGSARLVGKSVLLPALSESMTFGAFMTVIRTPYNDFLRYFFDSDAFRNQLNASATTTINQITKKMLDNIQINIPSKEERIHIVNQLDAITNLICLHKQQLFKLDELVKSRFIELFGEIKSKIKVSEVAKVSGGYAFKSGDIRDSGVKILQIGNVVLKNIDWSTTNYLPLPFLTEYSQFALSTNDIVIALTRPIIRSLGNVKTCIIRKQDLPCLLNQRVGKITTISANNQYLYYCFMTDEFTRYVDECSIGCSQPNISTKDIENYLIPNAPIELQNEFATFVKLIDKSKLTIQASLDKLEVLKKSLMQEYFG